MARKVFAITIARNEDFFLPRWIRYYGSQIGLENLFIIDHGSNDASTYAPGPMNFIRVPASRFDDFRRFQAVSDLHSSLLNYYDCGFVCDTDEFIVADLRLYKSLEDFVARTDHVSLSAIGLELLHIPEREPNFRPHLPILFQRRTVYFSTAVCKSCFAAKRTRFAGGCHSSSNSPNFDPALFLFHLKHFDYDWRLFRQHVTRSWDYAGDFGVHARHDLQTTRRFVDGLIDRFKANYVEGFDFAQETKRALASVVERDGNYPFGEAFFSQAARMIPDEFCTLF